MRRKGPRRRRKATSAKESGDRAYANGDLQAALRHYTRATTEEPNNARVYGNRSQVHLLLGAPHDALDDAEKCVQLEPQWPRAYFRQARALEALLRVDEAKEAYARALVLSQTEDDEEGIRQIRQALTALQTRCDDERSVSDARTETAESAASEFVESRGNPESDVFVRLVRWLLDGGAEFPSLRLKYFSPEFRGVSAKQRIRADESVLYVPAELLVTTDVALASDIGQKIAQSGVELRSRHSYIASFLLQQRALGETSRWSPYLQTLPAEYHNMPLFFRADGPELPLLRGSLALPKIEERRRALRVEYDNLCQAVPEYFHPSKKPGFALRDFVWARLVVITRIFGFVVQGRKTEGLVPMADMLNHRRPRQTKWSYSDRRRGFVITALCDLPRGEEVFDSYGRKCNSRFFVNYGFTLDNNEQDNECAMTLSVPPRDSLLVAKCALAERDAAQLTRRFQVPCAPDHKKSRELLGYARFCAAQSTATLRRMQRTSSSTSASTLLPLQDIGALSVENEIRALLAIGLAARSALQNFDTTLEEDEAILRSGRYAMFSNERNCVVMRRGEKQVLHAWLDLTVRCVKLLQTPWSELQRLLTQPSFWNDDYVLQVVAPLVRTKWQQQQRQQQQQRA